MALKSLGIGLSVLCKFTKEKPLWGLRELAKEMGISHTVLHRILKTLQDEGFVIQNAEKKYELGLKIFDLYAAIQNKVRLPDLVHPIMEEVSKETNETVFLTWKDGFDGVTVDIAESPENIKFMVSIGYKTPLYVGASCKAIMAFLDPEEQSRIIDQGIKVFTKNTVTEKSQILSGLDKIKNQGWCYTKGEFSDDVFGLGVPISNKFGKVIASLTVCGPFYRINENKKSEILRSLLEKKKSIEHYIQLMGTEGYR